MNNGDASLLVWISRHFGPVTLILLPLVTLVSFGLTMLVLCRGKGINACVALLAIIPMPLFVGVFLILKGIVASAAVIGMTDVAVKPAEITEGLAMMLATPLAGALLTLPAYLDRDIGPDLAIAVSTDSPFSA